MNSKENRVIVKCPHCGAEYTVDEIFLPNWLIGKSSAVVKDALGKILYIDYEVEPTESESYNCDFCHKDFSVSIEMKAKNENIAEELDFSNTTVSLF